MDKLEELLRKSHEISKELGDIWARYHKQRIKYIEKEVELKNLYIEIINLLTNYET